MEQQERQRLHNNTLKFIQSPQFINYLKTLYKEVSNEQDLLAFQRSYIESMKSAKVQMAFVWMVNSALSSGQVDSAPALLVSGAFGTKESEGHSQEIYMKIGTESFPSQKVKSQVSKMLKDTIFQFGRARALPTELTGDSPVYLLDAQLTSDCIKDSNGSINPLIPCLINPVGEVKVFAIPLNLVHQFVQNPIPTAPVSYVNAASGSASGQTILNTKKPLNYGHTYGQKPVVQKRSGLALATLVVGIISLIIWPLGPLALIFGFFAFLFIKRSKGRLFGNVSTSIGMLLALIPTLLFGKIAHTIIDGIINYDPDKPSRIESIANVKKAEQNLSFFQDGKFAFGNTPEAEKMATDFAKQMKTYREKYYEADESISISTQGHFLTHCELHEDSCAFIVHVPRLRKYNLEAKELMANQAWYVASAILVSNGYQSGFKMAVGTKGKIVYERIDVGTLSLDTTLIEVSGVEKEGTRVELLKPFFPDPVEIPIDTPAAAEITVPEE